MGRVVMLVWMVSLGYADVASLQQKCLSCHMQHQIPNDLVYRRYLMQYSTPQKIEDAMTAYIQAPHKQNSIMPPQFFLKFPLKKRIEMDEEEIRANVKAFMERFDVKKRLILEDSL